MAGPWPTRPAITGAEWRPMSWAASTAVNGTAFAMTQSTPVQVPAGSTYYFELRGTVAGSGTTYSVNTTLNGDSAYPTVIATTHNVATSSALSASNFIWAGNSTSTSAGADVDWSNGFSLPGLPSAGLNQNRTN